jgi:hypothetical protein
VGGFLLGLLLLSSLVAAQSRVSTCAALVCVPLADQTARSTALWHLQDENTRYIDIGPVNKVLNMLACWFEDPDSQAFKKHLPRWACGVGAGRAFVGNGCLWRVQATNPWRNSSRLE